MTNKTNSINTAAQAAANVLTDEAVQSAQGVIEEAQGKAAHAILKALGLKPGQRPKDEVIADLRAAYIGSGRNTIVLGSGHVESFGAYVQRMAERDPKRSYWTIEDSKKGKVMRLTADGDTALASAKSSWSALTLALEWRKRAPGRKSNEYKCPCCGAALIIKGQGKSREIAKAPQDAE